MHPPLFTSSLSYVKPICASIDATSEHCHTVDQATSLVCELGTSLSLWMWSDTLGLCEDVCTETALAFHAWRNVVRLCAAAQDNAGKYYSDSSSDSGEGEYASAKTISSRALLRFSLLFPRDSA